MFYIRPKTMIDTSHVAGLAKDAALVGSSSSTFFAVFASGKSSQYVLSLSGPLLEEECINLAVH